MGWKPPKWNGTYSAVLLGSHSTPAPCFRTIYLDLPVKTQEKTIITQNVLVTQSSHIVHCDQHTQKHICMHIQAFPNTLCLYKLMFFSFFRGVQKNQHNWKSTCHTKFWHSALQLACPTTYMCRFSSLSKHFFPLQIHFFHFLLGELTKQSNISHFVDFDWEKGIKMASVVHI